MKTKLLISILILCFTGALFAGTTVYIKPTPPVSYGNFIGGAPMYKTPPKEDPLAIKAQPIPLRSHPAIKSTIQDQRNAFYAQQWIDKISINIEEYRRKAEALNMAIVLDRKRCGTNYVSQHLPVYIAYTNEIARLSAAREVWIVQRNVSRANVFANQSVHTFFPKRDEDIGGLKTYTKGSPIK